MQLDLPQVAGLVSPAFAQRHGILIIADDPSGITVASAQPYQDDWQADLARSLGRPIRRVLANPLQIRQSGQSFHRLAQSVKGAQHQQSTSLGELEQWLELGKRQAEASADDAHIVHIVDWLLQYAIDQRASDIHLEPRRAQGQLRYRIDGLLHTVYAFPAGVTLALVSRLKHLGRLDVAEKRRPQDGRLQSRLPGGGEVELRLSTLPTPFGEKLVLRLFDPHQLHEASSASVWRGHNWPSGKACCASARASSWSLAPPVPARPARCTPASSCWPHRRSTCAPSKTLSSAWNRPSTSCRYSPR